MAADAIVVDASAALAIVRGEPTGNPARRLLLERARAGHAILVPSVFWVEIVNACARRYGRKADETLQAIAALDALGLITVETGRPGVPALIAVAVSHGLSAYDATYLALAESLGAELLTLDTELAAAAGSRSVAPTNEVRDAPGQYRLEPWIGWSGAHDYLDALRRIALDEVRR